MFLLPMQKMSTSSRSRYFGPEHKNRMIFIPQFSSIQPDKSDMFSENPGHHHGAVSEFCINYLSRMKYLNGIAINSWSSKDAKKIFENTAKVFAGTKHKNVDYFEIDWLIFTESTITVVETGMRGESKDRESGKKSEDDKVNRVISAKFDQIMKDVIIINHLLDATASSAVRVFYLVVFPNTKHSIRASWEEASSSFSQSIIGKF